MTNNQAKADFQAWSLTIPSMSLTRSWGFEIEAPQGWKIKDFPDSLNVSVDGSVQSELSEWPSEDCECDCEECDTHNYCDCSSCPVRNGYEEIEHCGSAGTCQTNYNEFASVGALWESKPSSLFDLCELLEGSEQNSSAGVHVHIGARDLSCLEVSRVLRIYGNMQWLMTAIAGRESSNFADVMTSDQGKETIEKLYNLGNIHWSEESTWRYGRYQAVNVTALSKYGTLEFRQMACNFNAHEIASWGRLHRALVNAVKAGLRPFETESITDFAGYIRILNRYTVI